MTATDNNLSDLLANETTRSMSRRRLVWMIVAVAVAALGAVALWRGRRVGDRPRYQTETATIGSLTVKVSVTGTLQPTNNVTVGSELSGLLTKVLVEENDRVKKGEPLAQLESSKLADAIARSRAAVASAEAQVLQSEATVMEARATVERYEQVSTLSGGKVPSRAEMDAARANLKRAEANAAMARAAVPQARAGLRSDETNLTKATIRSPIDGIVLARKVDPGQTVAATLQAPVLFTIAEDLRKMQLEGDVDEAEVGQVKVGQSVTFTVDAWPGRIYTGKVVRLGYGSETKDGVVTYPAVIDVDNGDLSLRPGMTATAEIVTITRTGVLLVPNAALRFSPASEEGAAAPPKSGGILGRLMPGPPADKPKKSPAPSAPMAGKAQVWVLGDTAPVAVAVTAGATNGQLTEIVAGKLSPGAQVITNRIVEAP
jgi:HlyD family secretion protein